MCEKDGEMYLYGLVTGATVYCNKGQSYYTRTSTWYDWIKQTATQLQRMTPNPNNEIELE